MVAFKGFIACSLDGFIARTDGSLDWLTEGWPQVSHDHGYAEFMDGVDAVAMGRATFDVVRTFEPWPFEKPVMVLSRTLSADKLPQDLRAKVTILADGPHAVRRHAATQGWNAVYVDGGQMLSAFITEGLLDSLTVTRLPVLIGTGRPLFAAGGEDRKLVMTASKAFETGFVQTTYGFERRQ
jgi:dihydrofolate reductase